MGQLTSQFPIPEETVLEINSLDRVENAVLRGAAEHWKQLRGERRFPPRSELNPASLRSALRYMALVRVIAAGADFEYRIVGDTFASAFGISLHARRLSAIAVEAPTSAAVIGRVYRHCVTTGEALAVSGITGRRSEAAIFLHHEAVVMPLGAADVDYLLVFAICDGDG